MPVGYNSTLEIVQGQGYVAIVQEMIHDTRVIPTDGRPHAPAEIKRWMGDSGGHWEGDTLVVETVNYNPQVVIQGAPVSDAAKVTERFTRIDADTIQYQFTVDDPKTWGKPFSAEYNMVQIDGNLYEYACHEGNYGMANNLSGARATEKKEVKEAKRRATPMRTKLLVVLAGAGMLLAAAPVWAHHAFAAEFDEKKPLKLQGIVTKWELVNPHSWIHLDVKGADGKITPWMVEGGSPNSLFRNGFTKESLPEGTEIIVEGYRAEDGANRAVGANLTYAKDGKRLFMGGSAPGANGDGAEVRRRLVQARWVRAPHFVRCE